MENIQELGKCRLFKDIDFSDIDLLLEKSDYYIKEYLKGADIYPADSPISHAGIILSGEVDVLHTSIHGDEEIVGRDCKGDIIGPAFCITGTCNDLSQFRVRNNVIVFFFNINKILENPVCSEYYSIFIRNLTNILASNNIILNRKIKLLTRRSLREKLMVYFIHLSDMAGSNSFELHFTREELARYVFSERSSVCRELGKMQDDGLIKVNGNIITISNDFSFT
ncbi:MAG: Crp/Fnr family transcriptional regulator [Butyrivibrio sp.]|uniref:Crp/Fnr family transcriptional regulator n=1 Tax=Butyrivibrio sp. TaxID=28121 RepID=UPI001B0DDF83|nr:Crp/Fnr family transcriptional regulator [Butyrivibrio sp.]MBO6241377.1 Crp/Fnr family transcriptional regulator [Butyrivibrio sp.]